MPPATWMAPNLAIKFSPDALSIDRLSIEDGKVTLERRRQRRPRSRCKDCGSTARRARCSVRSRARAPSPSAASSIRSALPPAAITDDGALKLHVNIDPVNHPLSIEADGMLALAGG